MSLIRPAEIGSRTARHLVVRTWPDREQVAVQHMPADGGPTWAVYHRLCGAWLRVAVYADTAAWLDSDPTPCGPEVVEPGTGLWDVLERGRV